MMNSSCRNRHCTLVRTLSWNDLWFSLDPEGWANVMSGKNIIGGIVAEWNQGYLLKW